MHNRVFNTVDTESLSLVESSKIPNLNGVNNGYAPPELFQNLANVPDGFRRFEEIVYNAYQSRDGFFKKFFDPRRDINDECGFPKDGELGIEHYRRLYDREAIACRVVQLFPKETWQVQPTVYEDEDVETDTEFEKAWDELSRTFTGSYYQDEEGSPVWSYLKRADILSGIGAFGVILLGIDDGKPLSEPVEGMPPDSRPVEVKTKSGKAGKPYKNAMDLSKLGAPKPGMAVTTGIGSEEQYYDAQGQPSSIAMGPGEDQSGSKKKGSRKLTFLRVFDESLVEITRYESDVNNPRFCQPVMYSITMNDPREQHSGVGLSLARVWVHWTRVIHIAETENGSSDTFGVPRIRPVYNNIHSLMKLYGGSAEMYWKGAFPGLSITTTPQVGTDVNLDAAKMTALRGEVFNYMNTLQRYLILSGLQAQTLSPTVVDPGTQISVQIEAICIQLGCPKRVFMGSERGELASSQDDSAWNDRIRDRQNNYVTPKIIIPFVSRLIDLKILPTPKGFSVKWNDLDSLSDQEKATVASTQTSAMATYTSGGLEALLTPLDFLTRVMGFEEESAKLMIEAAQQAIEEKQAQMEEQQQAYADAGYNPDGTPIEEPQPEEAPTEEGPPAEPQGNALTTNIIRKKGGKYRLYSHDGKNLGTFDTKEAAEKHEREVEMFKHMAAANNQQTLAEIVDNWNPLQSRRFEDTTDNFNPLQERDRFGKWAAHGGADGGGGGLVRTKGERLSERAMKMTERANLDKFSKDRVILKEHHELAAEVHYAAMDAHAAARKQAKKEKNQILFDKHQRLGDEHYAKYEHHFVKAKAGGGGPPTRFAGKKGELFHATKYVKTGKKITVEAYEEKIGRKTIKHPKRTYDEQKPVMLDGSPLPDHILGNKDKGIKGKAVFPFSDPKIAWQHVYVNKNPNGTMLVTAFDKRGSCAVKMGDSHNAKKAAKTFGMTQELMAKRESLMAEAHSDRKDPIKRDHAEAFLLTMHTGARPGSEKSLQETVPAYGVTTMEGRHVKVNSKGEVFLNYVPGKHRGKPITTPVLNPEIAAMVVKRAKIAGDKGRLFPTVSQSSLNEYTGSKDGGSFKTMDLRKLASTTIAEQLIKQREEPQTMKDYKKAVNEVADKVAEMIGNTRSMQINTYINSIRFLEWKIKAGLMKDKG
jgi:DNA topoisomerase IB